MIIHGLNKTTLLDYPEHVACTVFTGYCNMRCPFCHNGELVLQPEGQPVISEEEFFSFLKKRKNVLEGVAITGGEPTIQADLEDFIKRIREFGLEVKLDSNGLKPDVLRKLIDGKCVNYVAMDIKSDREHYKIATGSPNLDLSAVEESVSLLMENRVPYEFRTTVIRQFHNAQIFENIADWIGGCEKYFLQSYSGAHGILLDYLPEEEKAGYPAGFEAYTPEQMKEFEALLLARGMKSVHVRGIAE